MDNILQDLKALLTLSFLMIWDGIANFLVGSIFLMFDLASFKELKEYVSLIVWYIGAIAGCVYLVFRAYDMILRSFKTRIEKKLIEKKLHQADKK
jgi:hypothetical protein